MAVSIRAGCPYAFSAERGRSCPQQWALRKARRIGPRWRSEAAADKNVRAPLYGYPPEEEREAGSGTRLQ
jgi:hypothetical protein